MIGRGRVASQSFSFHDRILFDSGLLSLSMRKSTGSVAFLFCFLGDELHRLLMLLLSVVCWYVLCQMNLTVLLPLLFASVGVEHRRTEVIRWSNK